MEQLLEKLNQVKDTLDKTEIIKNYKKIQKEILSNKEIIELIKQYEYTKDERIKEKVTNNDLYKKYKHEETEINILILEINNKLKDIIKKDKCDL